MSTATTVEMYLDDSVVIYSEPIPLPGACRLSLQATLLSGTSCNYLVKVYTTVDSIEWTALSTPSIARSGSAPKLDRSSSSNVVNARACKIQLDSTSAVRTLVRVTLNMQQVR